MRLQTESRRASQLTSDHSSKRLSLITPLPSPPIRGHRRFASHSDNAFLLNDASDHRQLLSPRSTEPSSPEPIIAVPRRYSSRASPSFEHDPNIWIHEIEKLKTELNDVKDKLEETTHELSEANEAREASEQCAKVLRDYIADNRVGETVPYTPNAAPSSPLPAFVISKSEEPKNSSKWSFRLWNGTNGVISGGTSATHPASRQPTSAGSAPIASSLRATSPPPLARTFGSLFGTKTGQVSSVSSATDHSAQSPRPTQILPIYGGGSDASSYTEEEEPMSPLLGSPGHVMVRDSTGSSVMSDLRDLTDKEEEKVSNDEGYGLTPKVDRIVTEA
jgi:hypothetical protein